MDLGRSSSKEGNGFVGGNRIDEGGDEFLLARCEDDGSRE
jgi:hypothetical protein